MKKAAARSPASPSVQAAEAPHRRSAPQQPALRGACACGGGCPRCRGAAITGSGSVRQNEVEAERAAHAAMRGSAAAPAGGLQPLPATAAPPGVRSAGQPLPGAARHQLESAYGWDLGAVRLHSTPVERGQAHARGAQAFAGGSHIVHAGRGAQPTPHVLAHEVAHVVQAAVHPGAAGLVHHFESPEHEDLGDSALQDLLAFLKTEEGKAWAAKRGLDAATLARQIEDDPLKQAGARITAGTRMRNGHLQKVGLTPGEIIALSGDLYDGPDAIASAAKQNVAKGDEKKGNEIDQLLGAIGQERRGELDDSNKTYESITQGRYLTMAKSNDTHFAPKNRAEWRRLHEQALVEAKTAGTSEGAINHALLTDAAGGHFLTDAYASGHLFEKNELRAAIQLHLAANPLRTSSPEVQGYAAVVSASGNADQLLLKNIHDRLNQEGFDATNAAGMSWRTFGDAGLSKAPDTQRIASLAVFTSRQQVYAAQRGESPQPKAVEDLMPDDATLARATQTAIGYIPWAAANVQGLMYRGRKLATLQFPPVLGQIIESNLATIANPGRERQLLDMQKSSERTNSGPLLAPQFTLLDWK